MPRRRNPAVLIQKRRRGLRQLWWSRRLWLSVITCQRAGNAHTSHSRCVVAVIGLLGRNWKIFQLSFAVYPLSFTAAWATQFSEEVYRSLLFATTINVLCLLTLPRAKQTLPLTLCLHPVQIWISLFATVQRKKRAYNKVKNTVSDIKT